MLTVLLWFAYLSAGMGFGINAYGRFSRPETKYADIVTAHLFGLFWPAALAIIIIEKLESED